MKYNKLINLFILFLAVLFICIQVWLERFFGKVDIEQFVIFISFGFNGLLDTEDYIINKFIEICLYFPIAFVLLYAVFFKFSDDFFQILKVLSKLIYSIFKFKLISIHPVGA